MSDTSNPQVQITRPVDGATITTKSVEIDFWASDWDGLKEYDFLVDGAVEGTIIVSKSNKNSFTWHPKTKGSHVLTVKATDHFDNVGTSPAVNVIVV